MTIYLWLNLANFNVHDVLTKYFVFSFCLVQEKEMQCRLSACFLLETKLYLLLLVCKESHIYLHSVKNIGCLIFFFLLTRYSMAITSFDANHFLCSLYGYQIETVDIIFNYQVKLLVYAELWQTKHCIQILNDKRLI